MRNFYDKYPTLYIFTFMCVIAFWLTVIKYIK